jgi:AAA domain-containing protein
LFDTPITRDGSSLPSPVEYVGTPGPLELRPSGRPLPSGARRAILLDALNGVALGAFDESMIDWFVDLDEDVTRALVSLLVRVRDADGRGRPVRPATVHPGPEWITIAEICARLLITPGDWREWQRYGPTPLHVIQDGRALVRRVDFDRWLKNLHANMWMLEPGALTDGRPDEDGGPPVHETAAAAAARVLARHRAPLIPTGCGDCGPSRWIEDADGRPVAKCPQCDPGNAAPQGRGTFRPGPLPSADRSGPDEPRTGTDERTVQDDRWDGTDRTVSWNAADLLTATFEPPRWAVPGILSEGVTVLAGPPKVGKSWLALSLAVTVASGGKALGKVEVDAGPALYLALEDTGRRLQSRLRTVLAGALPPPDLTCVIECPALSQGGVEQITAWLDAHPNARLVVIDVFAKVRGPRQAGMSAYDADYRSVGEIKALADRYGVTFLVVHHTRKVESEDFLADVSGTNGIAGAADAVLVLRRTRGKADGVLLITGRDVDESEYAMSFDAGAGAWRMLDQPADELAMPDTRLMILTHLRQHPGQGPKQISEATGVAYELAKKTAKRMADDNQLHTDGKGRYFAPAETESPRSPLSPPQLTPDSDGDSPLLPLSPTALLERTSL